MKRAILFTIASIFYLAVSNSFAANKPRLPREAPIPGGIVLIKTVPASTPEPEAYFSGNRVALVKADGHWVAVVGLSLDTSVGPHVLFTVGHDGMQNSYSFNVKNHNYPKQNLRIKNRRQVIPSAEDLVRIKNETKIIRSAFQNWSQTNNPDFIFSLPVKGRFSSKFGLRRFFNDKPRKPHSGIDIAAPLGRKIVAPADGIIIVTGNYFFNGNTVFIDHGHGLVGMYNHLNKIQVKEGQQVKRGQVIGSIGKTGRVTGPHLHWSVSLNNSRINPLLLLDNKARKFLRIK